MQLFEFAVEFISQGFDFIRTLSGIFLRNRISQSQRHVSSGNRPANAVNVHPAAEPLRYVEGGFFIQTQSAAESSKHGLRTIGFSSCHGLICLFNSIRHFTSPELSRRTRRDWPPWSGKPLAALR